MRCSGAVRPPMSSSTGRRATTSPHQRWEDAAYIEELYVVLKRLCQNLGKTLLLAPMGVGFHVDHKLCAYTALRLGYRGVRVLFYEDFPYVLDSYREASESDTPAKALERLGLIPKRRYYVPYDVGEKRAVIEHYDSQVPILFTKESLEESLKAPQYRGTPSEFFWSAAPHESELLELWTALSF